MNITDVETSYQDDNGVWHVDAYEDDSDEGRTVGYIMNYQLYEVDKEACNTEIVKEAVESAIEEIKEEQAENKAMSQSVVQVIDKDTNTPIDINLVSADEGESLFKQKIVEYNEGAMPPFIDEILDDGYWDENINVTVCISTF